MPDLKQTIHPDTWLRRRALATALTEAGFPMAFATLETRASLGGGPPFRRWGSIPLYRWGDALAWAEARLSRLHHSTAEYDDRPPVQRRGRPPRVRAADHAA